ncbi:unnamed protein product, partial [Symbiodinium sp. KB8]
MARLGLLQDYNAVFSPGGQLAAYPLMAQWAGIGPAAAMETRLLIATSEEAVNAAFKAAGNADLQRAVLDIEVVVQVKAAEFGEDLPERLADPGYLRFRRQVHLADRLFASCADVTILELVDSQMLRDGSEGSHDECWTKMPRISLWPSLPVARAAEPIRALIGELSLNQKLTYILGRSLAQEVPWDDILPDSILELCRSQLRQLWEDLLESSRMAFQVDMNALADLAEKISACACFKPDCVLETVVEELFLATIADLMYFRFAILLDVNWLVRNSLQPFVDLAPSPQTALDRLLRQQKPRLLGHLKYARFQQVLKQTRFDGSSPTITLNRKLALSIK